MASHCGAGHYFIVLVSGQYCPIYGRVLEREVKHYEQCSANSSGAIHIESVAEANGSALRPVLIGEEGHSRRACRRREVHSQHLYKKFADFFYSLRFDYKLS